MKTIGVRELIEITDRGHPVARLVPITGDPWEDLISAGEVAKAAGPMNIDGLKPATYPHSASETLERLRSDER
jgi:antitoxin (DNA-binding transcriptional repressor) of toxin-antitoxin stability system